MFIVVCLSLGFVCCFVLCLRLWFVVVTCVSCVASCLACVCCLIFEYCVLCCFLVCRWWLLAGRC